MRDFSPLDETGSRKLVVRFGDESLNIAVTSCFSLALLHQRGCRVTISSFFGWIDRYGALIPNFGLCIVRSRDKNVAGKKRCMVKAWIKAQCFLVVLKRLVQLALRVELLGFDH